MDENSIYKGDDTSAFGMNYITVEIDNPYKIPVSKVEFVCGCIVKPYPNPEFPLKINFNPKETAKLNYVNTGYLIAYDSKNRPTTCKGSVTFYVVDGVIRRNGKV